MAENVDVDAARRALEEEALRLRGELGDLGHGEEGGLEYDANFADTSQVAAERGEAEVLASELQETLDEVEEALGRIERGEYGACENCGGAIGEARLEAMPMARLCMTCATKV